MNLYEVIEKYKGNGICVLNLRFACVTFGCDDVTFIRKGANGMTKIGTFPGFEINNCVKFVLHKETEEWYHFNNRATSDFTLSIKK